ncbi:carbohydrate kinase [Legionella beliardensis]|uniref:Bifunctional NAD(P)H-hydrate repair enzyme n=1 Tax=Legionella beliardensis TaxID=91822 RepID=A0A378I551_9GAMM|nr:NAD(P)H-hydrate dehydratase [Legionella beliardensis]STX29855.1 carbohydrate kinase [Legionella beliardensis]
MSSDLALLHTTLIRSCERSATSEYNISETELMTMAGEAAFNALKQLFPTVQKIIVYCGSGNNAGDGYVVARLAYQAGYSVVINQYKPIDQLPLVAQKAAFETLNVGVPCHYMDDMIEDDADLIVDALLGIGLKGTVKEPILSAINQINESGLPVLAIDLPSGLNADTGAVMGNCVRATATITFISYKLGMMTLDGPDYCGKIILNNLKLDHCLRDIVPTVSILEKSQFACLLPKRFKNCHKADFGHVLIIGGGYGMPGSVCLAAEAALRVGAGLVTIATQSHYATQAIANLPEVMIYGIEEACDILPLLNKATVCVIGPGLGTDSWANALFNQVITSQLPMLIDASALRLLAEAPQYDDNWILTPHPGEAASLLKCSTQDIQADRFEAVTHLQAKFGGNVVLKGVGSLIRTDELATYLCTAGNPGMATAGMGDVLSGVIAGLCAQGLALSDAAKLGVWLHASAADRAAQEGERGLIASDVLAYLRILVNTLTI